MNTRVVTGHDGKEIDEWAEGLGEAWTGVCDDAAPYIYDQTGFAGDERHVLLAENALTFKGLEDKLTEKGGRQAFRLVRHRAWCRDRYKYPVIAGFFVSVEDPANFFEELRTSNIKKFCDENGLFIICHPEEKDPGTTPPKQPRASRAQLKFRAIDAEKDRDLEKEARVAAEDRATKNGRRADAAEKERDLEKAARVRLEAEVRKLRARPSELETKENSDDNDASSSLKE